jgi:hypothetical protein
MLNSVKVWITKSSEWNYFVALFIIWAVLQVTFFQSGPKTSVDSALYIRDANQILAGSIPEGRNVWYLGYSLFLAVVFFCKGSLQSVIILQMIFSGVAAICLYSMTTKITKQKSTAIITVFLYLVWIKIHEWNTFIYTESLFTSMGVVSFSLLIQSKKNWQYLLTGMLLTYTFFIRPAGFCFVAGLIFFLFAQHRQKVSRSVMILAGLFLLIGCSLLLNKMLAHYKFIESYARAEIIYPKITLGMNIPDSVVIPEDNYPPLIRLIIFVWKNPLYFLKLSGLKLLLFFGNVKPYFSTIHNLCIMIFLYPLYYLAIKGWRTLNVSGKEKYFCLAYISMQALTIALTTENWDGRFLIPILPFIFVLSATGITSMMHRFDESAKPLP